MEHNEINLSEREHSDVSGEQEVETNVPDMGLALLKENITGLLT